MATPQISCCTFEAYHDQMPPQPFVFRIIGQCELPEGLTASLARHDPDDYAANTAAFDPEVSGPEAPDDTPVVRQEVRYEEELNEAFETVTTRITLPVRIVS